jgi:tRNA(1-methyladenosine) methyltransferase and related methyltransferases
MADILNELPRNTQILYPKDIGYILIQMGISEGQTVLEAGTGSGSMTIALAAAVSSSGRVISYENKQDTQNLARKNLERVGLASRVDFKLRDIQEGFDEADADAFFLDVQNPYDYISQVRAALKPGGFFGSLMPTYNQVEKVLYSLKQNNFAFVEVCELLLRYYKTNPARLRPTDRMVAHTGFLVFARKIEPTDDPRGSALATEVSGIEEEY